MGLFDFFSEKPGRRAAEAKAAGYRAGYDKASGLIDQGVAQAAPLYDRAYAPFETLYNKNLLGFDAYGDAVGLNGAEGAARARQAWQTASPDYNIRLDSGLQALDRGAARRGMLSSGNTLMAEQKYGNDLAASSYGDFVSRLVPYLSGVQNAASGGANVLTGKAGLYDSAAKAKAGYGFQSEVGVGGANAEGEMAGYNASKNIWDSLFRAAELGTKYLTNSGASAAPADLHRASRRPPSSPLR